MLTRVARLYGKRDLRVETQELPPLGAGEVLLRMAAGGICGSDLHYYQDGGFGPVRVREPIIAGHEASGYVEAIGEGDFSIVPGMLVAINPSQPCGECHYCSLNLPIHCLSMRFMGSAMRLPHEQGMFRDRMIVPAIQCHAVGDDVSPAEAACAEPLAVCLHAVAQADDLSGKQVLVTGAGPIGLLTVAAIRHAGAAEIIVTDLSDAALSRAPAMGANSTVNVTREPDSLSPWQRDKGQFDVAFDCSAAGSALRSAFAAVKPRGTIVQVGVTGDMAIPLNALVGKEILWRGSQRFDREFSEAVSLISSRTIDVRPIISHAFPLENAVEAFKQAGDRSIACKVQLTFDGDR
ncbi:MULTISPECIES: L-idonate 5-dehydrogenase [Alphaproteobacteria]|uniref:L-idonate 5-dehydrogenase n=2 Tax=Alphaproteobacteria TaxID=28211 RepID=A0A512HHB3_9HYPH|nr:MULTISPECIES: L-idonate 5-dehydrogenase [Alphaproteobacteria]GEO84837.1 L-idonate 5-dehydrogenase [Ciceribacter naphthalenivorans]GLR20542.1 L-idonate 5-dehydrogenase [Ciceribacter naphthalenivorans]GLT03398.1 L-idonate 5-dehydrogenase [Sphingomonas psychrolutea]